MAQLTDKPLVCPILIGRASDLLSLHSLINQAKNGEGGTALISGEAGIGKSRMVAGAKTYAAAQGFLLLQGNSFPADMTYPYAPLLDLLRALHASAPPVPLATSLASLARDIFPLLPELVSEQAIQPSGLEPEQEKRRLFAVLANFFIQLSIRSPTLLIIEDAHWSDSTSLDFLHYLARHLASYPLLLLVTYRQEETYPLLNGWLAQLDRERLAHEIKLRRLPRTDVDTMLSAIFDERHTALDMRRFLHGELLDTIYTLTEGNPFFIEETLSSLAAEGDIFYTQGYWNRRSLAAMRIPRSIQESVERRTEQLGEDARTVLTLAAVAGRHFDFALLQQLTNYDEHHLLQIMKELVAAQLVTEESDEQFAFRHALTRQAIYLQLLARERTALHRTTAQALEQLPVAAIDAHLEDLASHFYQAHEWQKALDYAQRAGEKAVRLYAHRSAIDYFTWALDAAQHLSHPPSPTIYRARGQANEMLGEFEQAQHDYLQAMEVARAIQDRAGEWQAAIDLGFLWAARDYARTEHWFRQALALAEALNDPVLHARSLNRIGNWYLNVEQPHEALRYHREALALFEHINDLSGIAETLDLLGMSSYLGGDLIGGMQYYQQAIPLFEETGNRAGLTSSLATVILRAPTYQDDMLVAPASLTEVLPDAERALQVARDIGQRSAEAYALMLLGLCLGSQGAYDRALAADQQALAIAEEIEHHQWQAALHTVLGGAYSSLLALSLARDHFEQALALAQETHSLFWFHLATGYLASTSILLHDYARAEALLRTALGSNRRAQTMGQHMMWGAAIELALAQGYPQRALDIIDHAISSGPSTGEQSSLRVLKLRGEALAALKRTEEAEVILKAALALARARDVRPMQWRVEISLGNLLHTQGRDAEAEQVFASARTLIEALAANVADEHLREHFLQQALALLPHSEPASSARHPKKAPGGLTEREREVAILIAQGKSNQAIADALVVTKRTVETHIGNIMFKLGCSSRTQIAVWAVETGLVSKAETESSM